MKINLKSGEFLAVSKEFPMNVLEIQDTLDRLKIPDDKPIVEFSISEYDNMKLPYTLCHREFSANIYRLNLFAERLEDLDFSEMTAFKSLLIANPECTFEDMLMMTYGLDSVMVYPCRDCCELGETVIENEMIPELESCSDEILGLLDHEKIGRLMQEREGGVFIDGYYCVTSGYEPPDINIEIGRPENCFFRLLIVPEEEKIDQAQWVSLPCEAEITCDFYNGICLDFRSALPNLKFDDTHKIGTLNELVEQISQLSHDDFVKLKAVMECEQIHEISDTIDCISRLSEYQLDSKISDPSEFAKKYLLKNMPADFNIAILENTNLCDFGQEILCHKQGEITSYGAVSGRGQELYSTLTVQPKQQLDEDFEEWYAAFHDTTHHPHIHLIVYSTNPKQGYLTKDGINKIRSVFANDIFHDELQSIYQEQTLSRDELKALSENQMSEITKQIQNSSFTNKNLEKMIMTLHTQLRSVSGKKVYGYLPKEIKETVDRIFSELAKTPQIKVMYEKWCDLERAKYKTYTQKEKDIPLLEQNKVFQPVRNMIIRTVMQMKFPTNDIEIEMPEPTEIDLDIPMKIEEEVIDETVDVSVENFSQEKLYIKWSDSYKEAHNLIYNKNSTLEDYKKAEQLLFPF